MNDYGTCCECGKDLTREDVLNQIDAPTQAQVEMCYECWRDFDKDAVQKDPANWGDLYRGYV